MENFISIKNQIIRNPEVSQQAFVLHVLLKSLYFDKPITIYARTLKSHLGWENRKLKRYLLELHSMGLLEERYTRFSGYHPLTLNPKGLVKKNDKNFTNLPKELLTKKLPLIEEAGFRLMYYYESYINRTSPAAVDYAYPAFLTITRETGLGSATIEKYNRILWENHLINITKHKISKDYTDQQGNEAYKGIRYNNHYEVLVDNISKDFTYLRRKDPKVSFGGQ